MTSEHIKQVFNHFNLHIYWDQ